MKNLLLFTFILFSLTLSSQNEISINLNFSNKKADYLATVLVHDDHVYGATRQRDFEIDNETFLGLQLTKLDLRGNVIWTDSIIPSDIDEFYLAEEENMIIHDDTIFSIYSIISSSSEKEFLFNKHTIEGELIDSKRIPINGNLSLVAGIVLFNDLIYVIQESTPNKLELLEFDQNLSLLDSYPISGAIGNDITLSSSEDYLILSYSSWNAFNNEFNCKIFDKDLNIVEDFNDFSISEISSNVSAIASSDGGYIFSWSNDLSHTLFDTFPYPTVIYKYDEDFQKLWEYTFVHKSAKQFIGTIETEEGNIFGYGASDELYTFDLSPSPLNAYSAWCFLLSPDGELIWERAIFDHRYMLLNGFFSGVEHEDQFILGGLVDAYDPNSTPINDPSSWLFSIDKEGCWNGNCNDIILIENDSINVTNAQDLPTLSIQIYPNPTIHELNIKTPFNQFELNILSASGHSIHSERVRSRTKRFDFEELPSGFYYIIISDLETRQKYIQRIFKI